ncbi:hypothetical protein B8X02_14520 [Stenotrophomonas rhizophila]|nr:hypothetical protein B8X02_14520 [Stenotrophomonas rhizophila]
MQPAPGAPPERTGAPNLALAHGLGTQTMTTLPPPARHIAGGPRVRPLCCCRPLSPAPDLLQRWRHPAAQRPPPDRSTTWLTRLRAVR